MSYFGNNTSSADGTAVSDSDARQDDHVPCYPAVLADCDGSAQLWSIGAVAQVWVKWVRAAKQGDIGSDQGPGPNTHLAGVEDGAVEVDKHITSHLDIGAIVDIDWPLNPWIFMQDSIFLVLGRRRRR